MMPPRAIGRRMAGRIGAGLAIAALACRSRAATGGGPYRIGIVSLVMTRSAPQFIAFETSLRNAGYGDNLTIDLVQAGDQADGIAQAMVDIVRRRADVIVATGTEAAARAARDATATIPIVVLAMDYDPVAKGYVASLAHPGNNITGVNVRQVELAAKRAEMLVAAAAGIRRVIILTDPISADQPAGALSVLRAAGIAAATVALRQPPYDYDAALGDADGGRGDALLVATSPFFFSDCDEIAAVALRRRMPSSFGFSEFPTRGGLMSYGVDTTDMWGLAAEYVVRILKGARPADLPMQQPTKYQLVINLKTAKALGLTIPPTVLALADDVID